MEKEMQIDAEADQDMSGDFVFSRPNVISSPEKIVNSSIFSDNIFGGRNTQQSETSAFVFAKPAIIDRLDYPEDKNNVENSNKVKSILNAVKKVKNASPFSIQEIKKSPTFAQLEKNTKKTPNVRLEMSKSITCSDVPESMMLKAVAKEYFDQFGETLKITIRPKRKMITVYYATKDAANNAFAKSGKFLGHSFIKQWTTSELLSKPRKTETVKGRIASILNIDDDVKEELEAMTGLEYNLPDSQNLKALTAKAKVKKAMVVANKEVPKRTLIMKTATKIIKAKAATEKTAPKVVPKAEVQATTPKITISSATIEELQNQVRQAGTTSEEKYKILDARDRLMRLKKQSRQKSLSTAKVTKGTCPDMCPEKERYMREFQRQLAFYEQLEGGEYRVNHQSAVKQYSRSSADQEEPMAHDLRPVKSLAMTMSYLLHEIADMCEGEDANLADWYHYVWDRTRSIRKDITQQELCCPNSVELVEQCARFHVLSSERLCAEEAAVFDPKINSENLTKCLQSLKYMYHDLREHKISCPNEPEFRAYVILLNLNNGTFMSELATLPPEVQHSPEVKFALEVYSAIAMNNYSRFFKLVRKTTYLNACILMRYFNQVRVKALQVMVKAYCRTTSATEYPLYELIDILGFEDEDEAFEFCSRVGLQCDRDSLYMKLSRESFHAPDGNLEQNRAYSLVLSKRLSIGQSVGQCIAGGQLPDKNYEQHRPHCSFDAQGYLLPSSINAQDQSLGDPYEFVDEEPPPPPKPSFVKPPNNLMEKKLLPDDDDIMPIPANMKANLKLKQKSNSPASITFINRTESSNDGTAIKVQEPPKLFAPPASTANSNIFSKPVQPSVFSSTVMAKPALPPTNSPFNLAVNKGIFGGNQTNLFKVPTPSMINFQADPVTTAASSSPNERPAKRHLDEPLSCSEEKKSLLEREEQARKQQELEERQRQEREKRERLEREERARELASREYEELEREAVWEACAALCRAELDRLRRLEEASGRLYEELLRELCAAVLDEQLFIQDMLMEVERRLRDRLLGKYCRVWRQWAARRRAQRREALDNTPVWLQPESLEECARKLYHPEQRVAIKYARDSKRRSAEVTPEKKPRQTPIEFIINVGLKENAKSFEGEQNQHIFWKLVISWPILENKLTLWRHKTAVNKYLNPEDFTQEPIFIEHRPSPQESLDVCIRHFEGLICETCLTGMDALLFVCARDEDGRSVERRLTKSVLAREKLMPIPLCVLVFGGGPDAEQRPAGLAATLESLLESGHVSEYTVLSEAGSDELVALKLFQSAVLWLAINRSPAVPLAMDYLRRLFDDCITEELWLRIQGHLLPNPQLSKALSDPNFIIGLHNEAVNHIMDIVLDPESMSYTDFAPELKIYLENQRKYPCSYEYFDSIWKHPEYRAELERVMSNFILPSWKFEWPIQDLMELHKAIATYSRQTIPHVDSLAVTNNIMSDLFLVTSEESCPNFADVVIHIVEKKISSIGGNTRVVYNKNHIKHFQTLPWWFKSSVVIDYVAKHPIVEEEEVDDGVEADSIITSQEIATSTAIEFEMDCDIDELNETCQQQEDEQPLEELCNETRSHATEVRSVVAKFEQQLEEQRLKSQSLEDRLKQALQDDFLDVGS